MKLDENTLAHLALCTVNYPNTVRMPQMDRKVYKQVDAALQALGGKWSRKLAAHVFEDLDDPALIATRIDAAIALGAVTTNADLGFFATPAPLARELAAMAEIDRTCSVLEPSAGAGHLYREICKYNPAFVALVERDHDRRQQLLRLQRDQDEVCGHDDFLDFVESEPYDRVVMNPPFYKVGRGDHLDHVRHAYGMLGPGGILVAVLPAGVLFRGDKRHKQFRATFGDLGSIKELPEGSFKASGTDVRTCVLRVRRA